MRTCGNELAPNVDGSAISLAISGDPVAGRALVLLLSSYDYDVRFVSASDPSEPQPLEEIRLLLLIRTQDHRENVVKALKDTANLYSIPILNLVPSDEIRGSEPSSRDGRVVPWPCSTEQLRRQIEAALSDR